MVDRGETKVWMENRGLIHRSMDGKQRTDPQKYGRLTEDRSTEVWMVNRRQAHSSMDGKQRTDPQKYGWLTEDRSTEYGW
jgi:hypothetical protein